MAKKIVTIQKLDDMAGTDGFGYGTVKQRFINNFGTSYTNNRCPNKGEILKACNGLINPISYYPPGSNNLATTYLVPEDEITFNGYDRRSIIVTINNNSAEKSIDPAAFNINIFYDDKNGNITNLGSASFPIDDLSGESSWVGEDYPINTSIRKSALTTNGRVGVTISYDGYYSQIADESWFTCISGGTGTTVLSANFMDYNDDGYISADDDSTRLSGLNYPLLEIDINSMLGRHVPKPDPDPLLSIPVHVRMHNYNGNDLGGSEIFVTFKDKSGDTVGSTWIPSTRLNESTFKTVTLSVRQSKKAGGKIEIYCPESYTIYCDYNSAHTEGDGTITISNIEYISDSVLDVYK